VWAVGSAVDLRLASANSSGDPVAYLTGSPFIDELNGQPRSMDSDGMFTIPETPGTRPHPSVPMPSHLSVPVLLNV
jgi:hypothetical protein